MAFVLRALVRTVPFFVVFYLARFLAVPADVVGENVRLGLLIFGLTGLAATVWAVLDCLVNPLDNTVVTWCATAVIVALSQPVVAHWDAGRGYSMSTAWGDLASLSLFMFGLIALPATLVAVMTHRWLASAEPSPAAIAGVVDLTGSTLVLPGRPSRRFTPAAHALSETG